MSEEQYFSIKQTPPGISYSRSGNEFQIEVKQRSLRNGFILLFFTTVWSSISMGIIYGQQILSNEFDLVLSLFGLPFLAGSGLLVFVTLQSFFGKHRFLIDKRNLVVQRGFKKHKLEWRKVKDIVLTSRKNVGLEIIEILAEPKSVSFVPKNPVHKKYLMSALKYYNDKYNPELSRWGD